MLFDLDEFFTHFVHYCKYGNQRGWHENGTGGISMMMPDELVLKVQTELDMNATYHPLDVKVPGLAREFLIVTADQKIWDEIMERPTWFCGIVQICPKGESYRVVYGLEHNELSADFGIHLQIHEQTLRRTKEKKSIVYHCHPTYVTALTYVLPLEREAFGESLMKASVHCALELKTGIGLVNHLTLDMETLARETMEQMQDHNVVIWPFHGLICSGESLPDLMGQVEILEKAAKIRMNLLQLPGGLRQEPSMEELETIRKNTMA